MTARSRSAVGVAWVVLLIAPASAGASTCAFDAAGARVEITPSGIGSVVARGGHGGSAGDPITLDGTPCDGATVGNTDTIELEATWAAALVLSLEGGPLAPGRTDEDGGSDEIEVVATGRPDALQLTVRGGAGADHIVGGRAAVNLNGGEEEGVDADVTGPFDWLDSRVEGRGGDDRLSLRGGSGTGAWTEWIPLDGGPGDDVLLGSDGYDRLSGGEGADRLEAGAWNDELTGGPGADQLDGGETGDGVDMAYFEDARGPVVADLRADEASRDGYGTRDTLERIEGVHAGHGEDRLDGDDGSNILDAGHDGAATIDAHGGDDYARGTHGDDVIRLGSGNDIGEGTADDDRLEGGPGDDRLMGHGGDDSFDGGAGQDVAGMDERQVVADLRNDLAVFPGTAASEPLVGIEGLYAPGSGDDLLIGDDGDNSFDTWGYGHDVVRPGGGDDEMVGGMLYDYSDSPVAIRVTAAGVDDGQGGFDTMGDQWNYTVRGSRFDDVFDGWTRGEGGPGDDTMTGSPEWPSQLDGGPGNDVLRGAGHGDDLTGGPGRDEIIGGESGRYSVRDGEHDSVRCNGANSGDVYADLEPLDLVENCDERWVYRGPADPGPTLTPTPTPEPTVVPTPEPTVVPTPEPTAEPTVVPTPEPTVVPTPEPTADPTPEPTAEPTPAATTEPTSTRTPEPTVTATPEPAPTRPSTPQPTATPMPEPDQLRAAEPLDLDASVARAPLRRALRRGVSARFRCDRPCLVRARLELDPATGRRSGLRRRAIGTAGPVRASRGTVRVRIRRAAARRLAGRRDVRLRLRMSARGAAGGADSAVLKVRLRR